MFNQDSKFWLKQEIKPFHNHLSNRSFEPFTSADYISIKSTEHSAVKGIISVGGHDCSLKHQHCNWHADIATWQLKGCILCREMLSATLVLSSDILSLTSLM